MLEFPPSKIGCGNADIGCADGWPLQRSCVPADRNTDSSRRACCATSHANPVFCPAVGIVNDGGPATDAGFRRHVGIAVRCRRCDASRAPGTDKTRARIFSYAWRTGQAPAGPRRAVCGPGLPQYEFTYPCVKTRFPRPTLGSLAALPAPRVRHVSIAVATGCTARRNRAS